LTTGLSPRHLITGDK